MTPEQKRLRLMAIMQGRRGGKTYKVIAAEIGVSASRVQQLEAKVLRLRSWRKIQKRHRAMKSRKRLGHEIATGITIDRPDMSRNHASRFRKAFVGARDQFREVMPAASDLGAGLVAGQDAVLLAAICAWVEQMPAGVAKEINIEKVLQSVIAPSLGKMLHGRRIADRNNYPPIRKGRFLP